MSDRPALWFRVWDKSGMLLVLAAFLIVASFTIDNFASGQNAMGILSSVTTVGLVSCTMMFCLASGDFDLSVGATAAFGGMVCVTTMNQYFDNPALGLALGVGAGLAAGAAVGYVNGVLIAKANINALIATLATMQIVRSRAFLVTDGKSAAAKMELFNHLGQAAFPNEVNFRVSLPIWLMGVFFVVFGVLLNRTTFGRNALAIGGNKEAARLAGIAVDRTKIIIFTMQGAVAAFAGIVVAAQNQSGHPGAMEGLELRAIAACVLGGVSLTGGVASMGGVIVGLLIMGAAQNAMNLMNVQPFHQGEALGWILLGAVLLDSLKQRLRK